MTNAIATCIIKLLAEIKLSNETRIHSGAVTKLLNIAVSELSFANSDERFCIIEAIDALLDSDENLSKEEIEFYEGFIENFGLL